MLRLGLPGAVDLVQLAEGALRPDDEATDITARSKTEQVQLLDVDGLHAGDVAEATGQTAVIAVDDHRAEALHATAVAELALAGAEALRLVDALDVLPGVDLLQKLDGLLGLGNFLDLVRDNQRELGDFVDGVSFRGERVDVLVSKVQVIETTKLTLAHNQRGNGRGSDSRDDGVSALVAVDLAMPAAPHSDRTEHATTTAHVAEGTLARAVSAATSNTGNTRYGTTGAP